MRVLRRVFQVVVALVGLLLVAGLFLPGSAHIDRSIVTTASPAAVYDIVSGFRRFNEWSPWFDLDPAARYTFSGPEQGVGSKMTWTSDKREVGSGSQEILAVEPGRSVTTKLDFGAQGQATSTVLIEPEGSGSRVTWAFDTSFEGDYFGRYFGLLFDRLIGADYEKGLARLKAVAERTPASAAASVN